MKITVIDDAETYEIHYGLAAEQILAYLAGKPIHVANPEVLQRR